MTIEDQFLIALTCWRENRGGGMPGMTSVANVIQNRAAKTGKSPYAICTAHAQFSSISMPGPESCLWGAETDPDWIAALTIATQAAAGTLVDLTGGATLYYAPAAIQSAATFTLPSGERVPFPAGWNAAAVKFTVEIADQLFFTE
jgi:hypothetical protein